jgi:UDPglucose 6-dehydrogenase
VVARFGEDLSGRTIAILGLAFKPDTDDMREAPRLVILGDLARRAALAGADALLIVIEWREFRNPDFQIIRAALKQPLIIDGRNLFDPAAMRAMGIEHLAIGRGESVRKHALG